MSEPFKINIYFDEKGEDLEKLIEQMIINMIEIKEKNFDYLSIWIHFQIRYNKMNSNYYIKHGKEVKCLSR